MNRIPPPCRDARKWLRAHKVDLAPLTGQDSHALATFAHALQATTQRSDGHPDILGSDENKEFIEHSREDVERLLLAVRELKEENQRLRMDMVDV